jgi:hypothetical protein
MRMRAVKQAQHPVRGRRNTEMDVYGKITAFVIYPLPEPPTQS